MKFEIQIVSNSSLIAESSITVGYLKKKTKSNKDERKECQQIVLLFSRFFKKLNKDHYC